MSGEEASEPQKAQKDPTSSVLFLQPQDPSSSPFPPLHVQKHVEYIAKLAVQLSKDTSYEGAVTEHLRMSGIYWSLTCLHLLLPTAQDVDTLMGVTTAKNQQEESIVDWVWTCYHPKEGSFGGNTGHPGHLLYTLSALQILALSSDNTDSRLAEHRDTIVEYIVSLQQPDGSFVGDRMAWEVDTRFTYCALQSLALLGALSSSSTIRLQDAVDFVLSCRNVEDGGFGSCQGAESHAGQVFCCVGALAIAKAVGNLQNDHDDDILSWWLAERQVDSGGLNGRPEKQADVCYSWWILSSLSILDKIPWISSDKLAHYILQCQDDEDGGIADRPEDMADAFHTFFGIAGLSLLGYLPRSHRTIDPLYALPTDIVKAMQLPGQVLVSRKDSTVDERLQHYDIVPPSSP